MGSQGFARRVAVFGLLASLVTVPLRVRASEAEVCASAYEKAQRLRRSGKLRAARTELLVCARDSCPRVVRPDCAEWLAEVERTQPTVVITARDDEGHDTTLVRVLVDGEVVAERLDGRSIELDPGPHEFRFESGTEVLEDHLLVAEGVKQRLVVADFRKLKPPPSPPPPPASPSPAAPKPEQPAPSRPPPPRSAFPLAGYVAAGASAIGLASFTAFAIAGKNVESCRGACSDDEIARLRRDYLIADVSLGVAVVAAGIFCVLLATSSDTAPKVSWGEPQLRF